MIDIAMLTCDRARITELAITELHRRTTMPHRLIVLDNGSTDGTPDLLFDLVYNQPEPDRIDWIEFAPENNGVHWGHNTLLEMVKTDLYISTDNDLVPSVPVNGKDWLQRLVDLMDEHPDYAAIACRPHTLPGQHGNLFDDSPPVRDMGHVGAHLRLMRTEAVRAVGGWRKHQNPGRNDEEKWICGQLRKAGWKVGYARDVRCIHLWGEPELGEDSWGYKEGSDHGHRAIWPPPHVFNWDRQGVDWETCK